MNFISFSLFNHNPKYLVGAFRNLILAKQYYPGWQCVYYVDDPYSETAKTLTDNGAYIIDRSQSTMGGYYWRHCLPNNFPSIEAYIVRDCDSRIGPREVAAVNEWLASDKTYHLMHDHPKHQTLVMQGMYGVKGYGLLDLAEALQEIPNERGGPDKVFDQIYQERMKGNVLEHGDFNPEMFPNQIPFPTPREDNRFIGEIFDENDQPNDDWKQLVTAP